MPLPRLRLEYFKVDLLRETLQVEPNTIIVMTTDGDKVIIRLSSDVFAVHYYVHKTPTCESPDARTLLVRAPDVEYQRMLKNALEKNHIELPYHQLT